VLWKSLEINKNRTITRRGAVTTISGADQNPNYFDFAMSSTGKAIAFYAISNLSSNYTGALSPAADPVSPGVHLLLLVLPSKAEVFPRALPSTTLVRPRSCSMA